MDSKRTKKELYLERLQKWREEKGAKQKPLKELKLNSASGQQKGNVKDVKRQTHIKPVVTKKPTHKLDTKVQKAPRTRNSAEGTRTSKNAGPGNQTRDIQQLTRTVKNTGPGNQARDIQQLTFEDEEIMEERLKKWKEQKSLSAKKEHNFTSVKKAKEVNTETSAGKHDPKKFKTVKSRLFDYLHKPATRSTGVTVSKSHEEFQKPATKSTGVTVSKSNDELKKVERQNIVKPKRETKPVVSVKSGVKRRHSEVHMAPAPPKSKRLAGILKRKSCIPSIDSNKGDETNQIEERPDETENAVDDHVFWSANYTNKDIPVAMVTPGTAAVTPGRSVRFVSPDERSKAAGEKFRKTPLRSSEMREHLSDWLKAKGRTPSKFRHLMCFHAELEEGKSCTPQTKTSLSVEELSEQLDVIQLEQDAARMEEKLTTMLDECMTLFEAGADFKTGLTEHAKRYLSYIEKKKGYDRNEKRKEGDDLMTCFVIHVKIGCPVSSIMPWLDDIYKNIPLAKISAQFYECKANVIKSTLDLDALLKVFETAMINGAQPREQIAKTLSESIKYVSNEQLKAAKRRKGTPRRSGIQEENVFQSSAIVYTVSEVTPFSESKSSRRRSESSSNASTDNCKVITPVRRSTRRSLQNLPSSLRDKKDMYTSLTEVDEKQKDNMLFQPNIALDSLLAQAEVET